MVVMFLLTVLVLRFVVNCLVFVEATSWLIGRWVLGLLSDFCCCWQVGGLLSCSVVGLLFWLMLLSFINRPNQKMQNLSSFSSFSGEGMAPGVLSKSRENPLPSMLLTKDVCLGLLRSAYQIRNRLTDQSAGRA